ncbi:MAG: HAMP domain-containing histidine kinase [Lachnospiraceae bacterium]|nr:HAMP domain-containing histidine kinase [Lachnospiraceae bacterium]
MIQILRRRFIITAMLAISVLLLVLLGVINTGNIIVNNQQINQVLNNLIESEGLYTPPEEAMVQFSPTEDSTRTWPQIPASPTTDDMLGARYFFVRFDIDGEITSADISHIHIVGITEAQEMARAVYDGTADTGRIERFQFRMTQALDQQSSLVIFLDVSAKIRSIFAIFMISFAVGAVCWAAMLLFVTILSKKAIQPIAENIEKQKQFVTNAGHEIKTPLSIILISTDALELHLGANKWSQNIRSQAVRLTGLMQNLLTLAKMDESGGKLPASTFSANLLLEELLHPYYEIAAEKGISLQTDVQPDVMLHANRESIMQLFSILLDNAVNYTPFDGHITVLLASKGKRMIFQIENTCDTLKEMDVAKLFDRFYRCDSARTQKNGGYGIGLSAARAIVHAHGGSITVDKEEDTAIRFMVKL